MEEISPIEEMIEIQKLVKELDYAIANLKPSREKSLAVTKLEECGMWLGRIKFRA